MNPIVEQAIHDLEGFWAAAAETDQQRIRRIIDLLRATPGTRFFLETDGLAALHQQSLGPHALERINSNLP
jgi:hypothetical protein